MADSPSPARMAGVARFTIEASRITTPAAVARPAMARPRGTARGMFRDVDLVMVKAASLSIRQGLA
ncbi:hypothetical protein Ssi02_24420 [Sinosporangium siamense]|uniref:Uncharacterized protein n=1 Tax=Sinosporangium siamense TaxID=1367973 RepID=A0A919RE31_9ACTN|nr:hypothetical protein Ssi02_24420 [Sinosporangium siamense]